MRGTNIIETGTDVIDFANPVSVRASLRRKRIQASLTGTRSTAPTESASRSQSPDETERKASTPTYTHASSADIRRVGKGAFFVSDNGKRLDTDSHYGRGHRRRFDKITNHLNEDRNKADFPPFDQAVREAVDRDNTKSGRNTTIRVVGTYEFEAEPGDVDTEWRAIMQITESESLIYSPRRWMSSALCLGRDASKGQEPAT